MTRKGKEIDLGGLRIQVDPLVLITRVLMRQKILLAIVALIGGIATATSYLMANKKYSSRSNILIRYENFEDQYLQKLLNVAVGYLGADLEMMVIINELNLYEKTRQGMPYEMALRTIRRELSVRNASRNIEISFISLSPIEAQRVVAFVTERLLGRMAELNEAPFEREAEAIQSSIAELEPKKEEANRKLYEFKAKHPEIASRLSEFMPEQGGPATDYDAEIRRAEQDLIAAKTGKVVSVESRAPRNTAAMAKLRELQAELKDLQAKYADAHPEVRRQMAKIEEQKKKVADEQNTLDGEIKPGTDPEEARKQRVARAQAHLNELLARKVDAQSKSIAKPRLQREWAELSLKATTYNSELSQLLTRFEENKRNRLLAANRFQENFQLVDAARVPEIPSEPNRGTFMGMGMAVTAAIGLLLAAMRESLRQTFVDATEFEQQTGLQVFAVLPRIRKEEAS